MRFPRTLFAYLAREIAVYSALAFACIAVLLVSQNLFRRLSDLLVVGFGGWDLLSLLGNLAPMIAASATPIALLFGVSLGISRLSADSEVTAMFAGGFGLRRLLVPPLVLGVMTAGLTAYVMIRVEPQAQRALRTMFKTMAARGGLLEGGRFRNILGRIIYVDARDRENHLRGVMISDFTRRERPFLIFAERGEFEFDAEGERILLSLNNGAVHVEKNLVGGDGGEASSDYQRIDFRRMTYIFGVGPVLSGKTSRRRPREMSVAELRQNLALVRSGGDLNALREKDPVAYELQIQRRFALPIAPLLFAGIAVPLALRRSRSARAFGILASLAIAFAYYSLLSLAEFAAHQAGVPAWLALWIPNALLAATALLLVRRAERQGLA